MQNIINYFNTFLSLIFGSVDSVPVIQLLSPSALITAIQAVANNTTQGNLGIFVQELLRSGRCFSIIFSSFVWGWFSVFIINLLIIFPYKWVRSVVKR